jgi:hypothetical protein
VLSGAGGGAMSARRKRAVAPEPIESVSPAGPVAQSFLLDFANRVKILMGPFGSGKTTTCMQTGTVISAVQPICHDGVIRSKGVVIRDTFRNLEKTVLGDWFDWFPKEMKDPITGQDMWDFQGGNDRPAVHTRRWKTDRGIVESIVEFIGIGEQKIENITRGARWTWGWVNECDLTPLETVEAIDKRLPRYPPRRWLADPKASPIPFLIGDLNAPDRENWVHKILKEGSRPGWKLYEQPGGMEPDAENKQNLPDGYYENMIATMPDWQVQRFVHNKFGYSRHGKPVYPEFNERKHVAPGELKPVPQISLRIGMDGGGTPAAIIMQRMPNGQVCWLDEIVSDREKITGPQRFARAIGELLLTPKYRDCTVEMIDHDPSALYGADTEAGELAWIETVARELGVMAVPHYTNEPALRQAPVRDLLTQDIDGRIPALIISRTCRLATAGMAYGYRYENVGQQIGAKLKEKPEKNHFSHPCEAGEYGTGSYTDRNAIIDRSGRARQALREGMPAAARARGRTPGSFDVFQF